MSASESPGTTERAGLASNADGAAPELGRETTVISRFGFVSLVAFLTFCTRYFLADHHSYWLDELYSVERYVNQYESVRQAIASLAESSIHPPLYQFILYYWVELFGSGETATRTLSNIYVTIAIVLLHRLVARAFDESLANSTALAFSLTYGVVYYGMETRSYGQSLLLAVASSYAVIAYLLPYASEGSRARQLLRRYGPMIVLTGANVGLMLTHYYNFFFLVAQAAFVGACALVIAPDGKRIRKLGEVAVLYTFQVALFLIVWGRIALESYRRNTGRYDTEQVTYTPQTIVRVATEHELALWGVPMAAAWALVLVLVLWGGARRWSRRSDEGSRRELVGGSYLLVVVILTAVVGYVAFVTVGAERLAARYILYLGPLVLLLFTLAIREALDVAVRPQSGRRRAWQFHLAQNAPLVVGLLLLAMVLPNTLQAVNEEKSDWRGMAQTMVAIADSNPAASYVVYEPAFRSTPVYDFYLARYSDDLRVQATIRRWVENRGEDNYSFQRDAELLEEHDYMMIPFVHHRVTNFPRALELLEETYEVHHRQIGEDGKGLIIFSLR